MHQTMDCNFMCPCTKSNYWPRDSQGRLPVPAGRVQQALRGVQPLHVRGTGTAAPTHRHRHGGTLSLLDASNRPFVVDNRRCQPLHVRGAAGPRGRERHLPRAHVQQDFPAARESSGDRLLLAHRQGAPPGAGHLLERPRRDHCEQGQLPRLAVGPGGLLPLQPERLRAGGERALPGPRALGRGPGCGGVPGRSADAPRMPGALHQPVRAHP